MANFAGQNFDLFQDSVFSWPNSSSDGSLLTLSRIMNVDVTKAKAKLYLPPANGAGAFENVLFVNNSLNNPLEIWSSDLDQLPGGSKLLEIPAVQTSPYFVSAYYLISTDNTTAAGVWSAIAFGSSGFTVEIDDLVGAGLTKLGGSKLNETIMPFPYSASTTSSNPFNISVDQRAQSIVNGDSSGPAYWSLPSSGSDGTLNGLFFYLNNSLQTTPVTVTPAGSDTINNGSTSLTIVGGNSTLITTDGAGNWYTLDSMLQQSTPSLYFPTEPQGSAYTVQNSDLGKVIVCSNNIVLTLPDATTLLNGFNFFVVNNATDQGRVQLLAVPTTPPIIPPDPPDPPPTPPLPTPQTINGITMGGQPLATPVVAPIDPNWFSFGPQLSCQVVTDGANWYVLGLGANSGNILEISFDYTILPSDFGRTIALTNAYTITLDTNNASLWDGFYFYIANYLGINPGGNTVIQTNISNLNGQSDSRELSQGGAQLFFDGTDWWSNQVTS